MEHSARSIVCRELLVCSQCNVVGRDECHGTSSPVDCEEAVFGHQCFVLSSESDKSKCYTGSKVTGVSVTPKAWSD